MSAERRSWVERAGPAGAALLSGALAGLLVGGLRVLRSEDLPHGMYLLAATRVVPPLLAGAGCGGLVGLALTLAAAVAPRRLLVTGAALGSVAGIVFFLAGSWHDLAVPADVVRDRPRLAAAATAAIVGLWIAPWAAVMPWSRPAAKRLVALAGAAGAAAALVAVAAGIALPLAARAAAAGRPSVIVVSLDTMRADALGALGGSGTPKLDRIASEGVLFERAIAPAPWTLPSHASIFTSRLPFDHGVRFSRDAIRPPRVTLAEAFRNAGYRTAAFTGDAYLDARFGFDQGFERYEAVHEDQDLAAGPAPIAEAALRWIRSAADRPFFVFVHTYEPHSPFTETDLADDADRGRLPTTVTFDVVEKIHDGTLDLDDAERRYVRDLYRGDVARTDRVMGGLLDTLRADGILDRAVLVVLSDHGEDFWEHDMRRSPGHGHALYEELLHVPLIVRAPAVPRGGRVRTPVGLVDVAPTVVEMCGLPAVPGFQGRSLAAALAAGREPEPVPVWSESVEYGPDRFALREGRYKAIVVPRPDVTHGNYRPSVQPLELFDLESDPGETRNLAGEAPDEARPLVAKVADRGRGKAAPGLADPGLDDPSDELLRTLRSLGYVE